MQTRLPVKAVVQFSHSGHRSSDEDQLLALQQKGIFIVADGFGGPTPGKAAARLACEGVRDFLDKEAGDLDATLPFVLRSYFSLAGNVLFNALVYANIKVLGLNKNKNVHEKGGASVLGAFMDGDLLALANVGACTGHLFRSGKGVELVTPRTYGKLAHPFQGAALSDHHRIPLMALGMAEDLEPEIFEYRIRPGDWLVLSTDGIKSETLDQVGALQAKKLSSTRASDDLNSLLKSSSYTENATFLAVLF